MSHRTHPSKVRRVPPGYCRWCAKPIYKVDGTLSLSRSWCGPRCVTEYLLRTDSKVMRQHVFFRDQGRCAACGIEHRNNNSDWEADHILPLFTAMGDSSYWEPENVQILCVDPCHRTKTASDRVKFGHFMKKSTPKRRLDS
jgi:hypothetical protein